MYCKGDENLSLHNRYPVKNAKCGEEIEISVNIMFLDVILYFIFCILYFLCMILYFIFLNDAVCIIIRLVIFGVLHLIVLLVLYIYCSSCAFSDCSVQFAR